MKLRQEQLYKLMHGMLKMLLKHIWTTHQPTQGIMLLNLHNQILLRWLNQLMTLKAVPTIKICRKFKIPNFVNLVNDKCYIDMRIKWKQQWRLVTIQMAKCPLEAWLELQMRTKCSMRFLWLQSSKIKITCIQIHTNHWIQNREKEKQMFHVD